MQARAVEPVTAKPGHTGTRVLIVDDDVTNRMVLGAMLRHYEYEVLQAENGRVAVETFQQHEPALILMDIMMPVMDGYEATSRIRALATHTHVPIIFLTALTSDDALARCIEMGGDDFLIKPYSHTILRARIEGALRMRAMMNELRQQRDVIAQHRHQMQADLDLARRMFDRIERVESLSQPNLRHAVTSLDVLNGDIVLASQRPSGGQHILLGDFTGHGLAAAIGALAVSDVFYSMSGKGFGLAEILSEINRKLLGIMPVGRFLATGLVELDAERGTALIWNGGLPDVFVRGADGAVKQRVPSTHLPLGIEALSATETAAVSVSVAPDDRIYLLSDGLVEVANATGELFGIERVAEYIGRGRDGAAVFDALRKAVHVFAEGTQATDDVSLLEVRVTAATERMTAADAEIRRAHKPATEWCLNFELGASALRDLDPMPIVLNLITEAQGLQDEHARLYTVLTELFSNALEHGLLRLDSSIKSSPEGFARYYAERDRRLRELADGRILVRVAHAESGAMTIDVAHNGVGFAPECIGRPGDDETHGRGIRLVRSLTDSLLYSLDGRRATATLQRGAAPH